MSIRIRFRISQTAVNGMKALILRKLNSSRGVNRLIAVLTLLVAVLAVLIFVKPVRDWLWHGSTDSCDLAVRRTEDVLRQELLLGEVTDEESAREIMKAKGSFCAAGGELYLIWNKEDPAQLEVVCGLHDPDTERRTLLNSRSAFDRVNVVLEAARRLEHPIPDPLEITLNGKTLVAQRTTEEPPLRRGTRSTRGYSGTVLFYMADEGGELTYFCYADENHCWRWRAGDGWIGEGQV